MKKLKSRVSNIAYFENSHFPRHVKYTAFTNNRNIKQTKKEQKTDLEEDNK